MDRELEQRLIDMETEIPDSIVEMPIQIKQNFVRMRELALTEQGDPEAYDPLVFFGRFMNDPNMPPDLRVVCATKLLPYTQGPAPLVQTLANVESSAFEMATTDPVMLEKRSRAYDFVLGLITKAAENNTIEDAVVVEDPVKEMERDDNIAAAAAEKKEKMNGKQ